MVEQGIDLVPDIFASPFQRWISARHEAGHAVAALHYDCPFEFISIERIEDSLGKIRKMRNHYLGDLVAVMCGPLAEYEWKVHRAGITSFRMYGMDHELAQRADKDECATCVHEALRFMRRRPVQQQIDRVARVLLERTRLTADEVRQVSGFSRSLCSRDFPH
jgi:hypothetical protein